MAHATVTKNTKWALQVLQALGGPPATLALLLGRLKALPFQASSRTVMAQLKAAHALITHQATSSKALRQAGQALVNTLVNERLLPACSSSSSSSSNSSSVAAHEVGVACLAAIRALLSRSAATATALVHDKNKQSFKALCAAIQNGQKAAVWEAAMRCVLVVASNEALREQVTGGLVQVNAGFCHHLDWEYDL
jgi:aminopeptidase N